jgi:predicted Holliday junction resolvase-like endonuclease
MLLLLMLLLLLLLLVLLILIHSKRSLKPSEVSQTAAMKALVNTADMVRSLTRNVVEPVARCGGGAQTSLRYLTQKSLA